MADDKKPKIDLKSRLQKMGGPGAATPPPPAAGIPAPSPSQAPPPVIARPVPAPGAPVAPPSIPPPSGIPKPPMSSRPVALDPNNPLAAIARPIQSAPAPAAPAMQRIEVDELAVQQARGSARRQGFIGGLVLAVVIGLVAYVAGGAQQQGADRKKSTQDAHDLAVDILKAKGTLDDLKGKLTDGGKSLLGDRKYPEGLGKQLSDIVVDFSGDKLFGRRFSGVPADTLKSLMDFMARVETFNNKKDLVVSLLTSTKLKQSIVEDLSRPAGQSPVTIVAVVDKDSPGGACRVAALVKPINPNDQLGKTLQFVNPLGSGNVELPILQDPKIPGSGAVIPIIPTSFDKVCPSPVKGAETQLLSSMNALIDDIQGQKGNPDYGQDATPGLSDQAAAIADALNKVN
jgi:hypothetical protein